MNRIFFISLLSGAVLVIFLLRESIQNLENHRNDFTESIVDLEHSVKSRSTKAEFGRNKITKSDANNTENFGDLKENLLRKWDGLENIHKREGLIAAQREILHTAIRKLNGLELADFFTQLSTRDIALDGIPEITFGLAKISAEMKIGEIANWFAAIPNPAFQTRISYDLGYQVLPSRFEEIFSRVSDFNARRRLLVGHCMHYYNKPEKAMNVLLSKVDESMKTAAVLELIPSLNGDLSGAVSVLSRSDEAVPDQVKNTIIRRWVELDPSEAAAYVENNIEFQSDQIIGSLLNRWVQISSENAGDWVLSLKEEPMKINSVKVYVTELSRWNPDRALTFARDNLSAKDFSEIQESLKF